MKRKKQINITESQLNQIITESIRRVLKEDLEDGNDAPNELAEYMTTGMYSQAASFVARTNFALKDEAFDYAKQMLGIDKYIECLESMILCLGPQN